MLGKNIWDLASKKNENNLNINDLNVPQSNEMDEEEFNLTSEA